MKKRTRQVIEHYSLIQPGSPLIIGVSGGSDSVALLHIISSLYPENERIAVYIDHGLRPLETEAERTLVKKLAQSCSAKFIALHVDVTKEQKERKCSLEEAARNLRYKNLEQIRSEYNAQCIAVGHTSDDQAEEVLLRLIRGSGSAGLGGMAVQNGYVIRPLLNESKEQLRDYLMGNSLSWCEDSSNADTRFLRNKIRHRLLPILEQEFNQSIRQTLLQTASILSVENTLLDDLTEDVFAKITVIEPEQIILKLTEFSIQHTATQRRILEKICWDMSARPSYKQIASLQTLANAQSNSEIHLSHGLRAIKQKDTIIFHYPSQEKGYRGSAIPDMTFSPLTIHSAGKFFVPEIGYELIIEHLPISKLTKQKQPNTLQLDAAHITFPLTLRTHKKGETFHPMGAPGRKKVSRFLTDQKIPALDKSAYSVLLSQNKIIAVAGLRIDHSFQIHANTKEYLQLQWQKTDHSNLLLKPI